MSDATPELSYPIAIDRLGPAWQDHRIVASAEQLVALAERFGVLELKRLEAMVRARRVRAGRYIEIIGTLAADVVQSCVATLEPVEAHVEEEFRELYGPIGGERPDEGAGEILVEPESPEPLDGPTVDLGEAVAQHLALSLDPYPRAPGAGPAPESEPPGPSETGRPSPFAVLGALKPRQ
jgi:uncharacterized metal-binding protein YceD (DUF177 family)